MRNIVVNGKIISEVITAPDGQPVKYDIKDTIVDMLKSPLNQQSGTNYVEMEKVFSILRKIKKSSEDMPTVDLEEDEFNHLVVVLKNYNFRFNDPAIYEWIHNIIQAPKL